MSVPVHEYQPSRVETALAAERLGTSSVLGYVLSGVAPLTVAAGLITVAFAVTGITGIPFTLAVVVFFLCLFAVGFLSMAKYVSNAGAFYSYVARGLGRPFGVGAAVVAFGAYNCLQVALYGIFGVTAASMFAEHFGSQHSWWFWALVAWVVVAVLGTRDVKWVSAVLAVCIVAETIVILALSLDGLVHPAATGGGYTGALSPSGLSIATFSIAGAVAVLCFVGFEVARDVDHHHSDRHRAAVDARDVRARGLGAGCPLWTEPRGGDRSEARAGDAVPARRHELAG
jgi:amino acid transporter